MIQQKIFILDNVILMHHNKEMIILTGRFVIVANLIKQKLISQINKRDVNLQV